MAAIVHGVTNKPTFNFSPLSIPGCCLWLDGWDSTSLTLSGNNVTLWQDRSGRGNNFSNVGTGPRYSLNAALGRNGVVFDGSLNFLSNSSFSPLSSTDLTHFLVIVNSFSNQVGQAYALGSNSIGGATQTSSIRAAASVTGQIVFANASASAVMAIISNEPTVVTAMAPSSASVGNTLQIWRNENSAANASTTTVNATTINRGAIGNTSATASQTLTNAYVGTIFEIITYNRSLTASERIQVSAYLAFKWRNTITSWSATYPFQTTFDYYYPPYMQHARPFDPIDATNLVLWLDGSDPTSVTTDVNSRVLTWRDKRNPVGAAAPYTEPVGSTVYRGPIYNATDGSFFFDNNSVETKTSNQAGLRLMTFSNTAVSRGVYLTQTLGGIPSPVVAGNLACFIVFNNSRSATTTSNALIQFQNTVTPYRVIVDIGSGTGPSYVGPVLTGGATTVSFSTSSNWSTSGSYSILSVLYTQSNIAVRMNGTLIGTTTGSTVTLAQPTIFSIGAHIDDRTFTGYIKEILCYDMMTNSNVNQVLPNLRPGDAERVEGYLAHKWSLQSVLPENHSFKRVPPTTAALPTMTSTIGSTSLHNWSSFGVYNKYGDFKWKVIGGVSNGFTSQPTAVTTNSFGEVIVAQNSGNYQARNQDNTVFATYIGGNNAITLTSYHPSGYARWNSKLNLSTNNTLVYSLGIDNSDNILLAGVTGTSNLPYTNAIGSTIFTRDYTGQTTVSGVLAKYNIDGTPLWAAKQLGVGGTGWCPTLSAVSDTSNNTFIIQENQVTTGLSLFNGTNTNTDTSAVNIGPRIGNGSLVIAKYDPNGTVLNYTRIGATTQAYGAQYGSVLFGFSSSPCGGGTDSNGNFFVAGNWSGTTLTAFNHPGTVSGGTLTTSGTTNAFIIKYTNTLAVSALTRVGGTSTDRIHNLCTDSAGNVYICGTFASTTLTFFNAGGASGGTLTKGVGVADGFVAKYNNNLSFIWAAQISGISTTTISLRSITFDNRNGAVIAGVETNSATTSIFNAGRTIPARIWTKRNTGTSYGSAVTWWDQDNGALLRLREHSPLNVANTIYSPTQLATDSLGTVYIPQGYNNASNVNYYYFNQ